MNTYNSEHGSSDVAACRLCPTNAYTVNSSTTSIDDCLCADGFYDTIAGTGVQCSPCPIGTDCSGRATIDRLPLIPGYYRLDNTTIDVRTCPDAHTNCSDNFGSSACESSSGCQGGVGDPCAANLTGLFCKLCDRSQTTTPVYYQPASPDAVAQCVACDDYVALTALTVTAVIIGVVILVLGVAYALRKLSKTSKAKLFVVYPILKNKFKIAFGMCPGPALVPVKTHR
jgi:hypothetical protein